jgi:hypothetical protein
MAAAAPAMTWLPLNVVIVDNDRGDSPSSYRARALRAGGVLRRCPEIPPVLNTCKVAAVARGLLC